MYIAVRENHWRIAVMMKRMENGRLSKLTPETQFKNKVKKWMSDMGIYHIPYAAGMYSKSGVPDTLACICGLFIAIEFKAEKGKVDKLQRIQIDEINSAGGIAFVLYPCDFETFKTLLAKVNAYNFKIHDELRQLGR